jgi:hypothetical protein
MEAPCEEKTELKLKYRKMSLSVYNKLMLYQQVLKPIWTYGIQLWGCTSQSKRNIILYKDSRIEYSAISWMLPGTFEITTSVRIWLWKLSIASLKSMLNIMNNDYIGIPT